MDYQISGSDHLEERFLGLGAEGRVAQWSMGGAMFGLTAAVVQMLIRSLVIKRNKVGGVIKCCLFMSFSFTFRKIEGFREEELVRGGSRRGDRLTTGVTGLP